MACRSVERPRQKISTRFADAIAYRLGKVRTVDGIEIVGQSVDETSKVEQALLLIREHDPVRYRHLLRNITRIWIQMLPGNLGEFDAASGSCRLERRYVTAADTDCEAIAATLVHEATHARLFRMGIPYEEGNRLRVENICFRREQAFGRRLPNGGAVVDMAQRYLDSPYDYGDRAMDEAFAQRAAERLLDEGVPRTLVRFLVWVNRRRRA